MICSICNSEMFYIFKNDILRKYSVSYFKCKECEYICTEKAYWLGEAYSDAVTDSDTGLLQRNLLISTRLSSIFFLWGMNKNKFLDVAGGYGVLTRLMRDAGFDFYWEDIYCKNIFAKGFSVGDQIKSNFDFITAFEVLEHLEYPLNFIEENFKKFSPKALIFSTEIYGNNTQSKDWAYYSFETGQHISFYNHKTLTIMAKKLNLYFYTYKGLHIFSKKRLKYFSIYKYLTTYKLAFIINLLFKRRCDSRTISDSLNLKNIKY